LSKNTADLEKFNKEAKVRTGRQGRLRRRRKRRRIMRKGRRRRRICN
jgi:hypothetical protein